MADDKDMFVFVGAYDTEEDAKSDYEDLVELHSEGWVGSFDAAVLSKDDDGKLSIRRHTDSTTKGAWAGLAVGALFGLIFPPSVLVSGAVGAGAGALIGHQFNDLSKDDLKEMSDFIGENEAALVVVAESKAEEKVNAAAKKALKEYKKEFKADSKEIERQINESIKEM